MRYLKAILLAYFFAVALCAFSSCAHAHTLKPGECVAFTSDVVRFMKVRSLGYSLEDADDMLRRMIENQGWFVYVQDKEDVARLRDVLPKIWDRPDDAPSEVRQATLNDCDPDNQEQYEFQHWSKPHGM